MKNSKPSAVHSALFLFKPGLQYPGCLQVLYLHVFNHDGVLNVLSLQVDFDRLQAVEGNSDIHRNEHISHLSPKVQLNENTDFSLFTKCLEQRGLL